MADTNSKNPKTNEWLSTAFQKTINAGIAISGMILTCSLIAGVIVYTINKNTENLKPNLLLCVLFFIIGLIGLIIYLNKIDTANNFYSKLVVIWKFNPTLIYKYKRYTAFNDRPVTSLNFLYTSISLLILALLSSLNPAFIKITTWLYIFFGLSTFIAVANLPIINIYALRLMNILFGSAESVVFSRSGIYCFGLLYKFGTKSFTFHKAYKKQIGPFDTITFTYQRMRGYQILLKEINIPIPPSISNDEVNELIALYNSPNLYV